MTEDNIALAKRLVACRGWRWMPGMLASDGGRVRAVWPSRIVWDYFNDFGNDHASTRTESVNVLPDLTDAATLGCLLALVREAWGDPTATTAATREADGSRGWVADCWDTQSPLSGLGPFKYEAEALVAALEAAP